MLNRPAAGCRPGGRRAARRRNGARRRGRRRTSSRGPLSMRDTPDRRTQRVLTHAGLWTLSVWLIATSHARADALPVYQNVELQPLAAQARRVAEALEQLGQPLTPGGKARLDKALGPDGSAGSVQEALDPLCLIGVEINPESRVKAAQGPAPARLVQHGWRVFLVKVHNEAGVTAELRAESPNAAP